MSGSLRRLSSNSALIRAAARLAPAGVDIFDALGDIQPFDPNHDEGARLNRSPVFDGCRSCVTLS